MPWWMTLYVVFFVLILISNTILHIKYKAKKKILIYEIFSALYLLTMIFAYWYPPVFELLNVYSIIPFFIILGIDFYFSIWGKLEDIGFREIPDLGKKELDTAKAFSLIIASPAYIISILVIMYIIKI
ncbi:MAG: hypothetical protein K9M56_07145 [Victivallales bacterium]|nr:hypothetical protein [Victivallales bacterium]